MAVLAKLTANYSQRSKDLGGATGFTVLGEGTTLGHPAENPLFPQTFDGEALLATGAPIKEPREQSYAVLIQGVSVATLQSYLDELDRVLWDCTHQGGGVLQYRSDGASYVTRFRVAAGKRSPVNLAEYEAFDRVRLVVLLVVEPYGLADPYDVRDDFSSDTLGTGGVYNIGGADWTKVTGNTAAVSGGAIATSATTGATLYAHTGTPHTYGDAQATAKWQAAALASNLNVNVVLKYVDANNYTYARLIDNGASFLLRIYKVVAGVETQLGSDTTTTRGSAATWYWLRFRYEGNVLTAEHFTSEPTPMATAAATCTHTLSTSDAAIIGATVRGRAGLRWSTAGVGTISFDDFRVEALTYRNITFPQTLRLEGAWGGTVDALAGIYYTGSGGTAPIAMMYAWWPRVAAHNYVWNGGGEVVGSSATTAYGWTSANGATVTRDTTMARTGSASIKVVCPATAFSGAEFPVYRRGGFRKGVAYTFSFWTRCDTPAGSVYGEMTLGTAVGYTSITPATTSWVQRSVSIVADADDDVAKVMIYTNVATATTFWIDDVMVYEGTTAPTSTLGGFGPGIIPAAAYNTAQASLTGTAWTQTTDTDYLVGSGPQASGALSANGNIEYPLLPHLFTPDEYTSDEVDVAVFARIEVASTQTSLACAISMASERGTSYGARRYGSLRSGGKTIKLPSSGTVFKPYFLGVVTLKVDKTRPRREWLRLAFTNSGSATGTLGIDYLVVVPVRAIASTRRGSSDSITPDFIASTAETTKVVGVDGSDIIGEPGIGRIVEWSNGGSMTPDDGLLGEPIKLSPDGAELLVWPSDQVIDLTDSSASGMGKTWSGTVQVAVQPRTHHLRQS